MLRQRLNRGRQLFLVLLNRMDIQIGNLASPAWFGRYRAPLRLEAVQAHIVDFEVLRLVPR